MNVKIGDHVLVVKGSSKGYTGIVTAVQKASVKIKRDSDGKEVRVSHFVIIKKTCVI